GWVRCVGWVCGVWAVGGRYEWPPHDAAPDRPPSLRASGSRLIHSSISQNTKGVPGASGEARSLDLGFAEFDVLLGDRIVFLLHQLVGHGARILARHVIEAGVGAGNHLHFDGGPFRHAEPRSP